ncbi:Helicase-like, DEXD box c2 type [Corchorus olitorius]|uniref:Regulator of telomere elongation helicase 1 homolog n=1 Tax=Corchorus olitorius TaxID=93759 RepID=A0A1R3H8T7_9ROSI|nr:Helicase-like, DEXD box c2 type [Corchorus olitorius]
MPTYRIRGIDVDFPFEAYDCQLLYMEKVIEALQTRCNALLESPTGTGKTLCLLCATLAWRKSLGDFSTGNRQRSSEFSASQSEEGSSQSQSGKPPTIVYTSRTHSQLRQVVQELRRSSYRPKMVVLGSREQLCIHDEVSLLRGKAQTNACRFLCKKRSKRYCTHFPPVADYVKNNRHIGDEPLDIEDLVNIGKRFGPCPYYVSRELHKVADIVFAPYNYLIDRDNRKSLNLVWDNSILIFDEAHNLESICADAASFDLSSGLLTACISEAKNCVDLAIARREESNDKSRNPDDFAILRGKMALLLKLQKRIAQVPIESKELGFTKPGPYIYELLADLNITHETSSKLIDIIEEATQLLEEDKQQDTKGSGCRLESISNILKTIFRDGNNGHADCYRVHIQEAEENATDIFIGKRSRTLSWWCFNPGIAMQEFSKLGVGSIVLTSGTLSPLDSFAQELKLDFPVRLENPHVISSNQLWVGVVPVGPSGRSFNSSYRNRDSPEYKQELGNAIVNFARIVPDGLLVFFPSYYLLDQCISCWKNMGNASSNTIWERICKFKKPVIEPRQSSLFPLAIEDYLTKLKDTSTSGAVFFAVCRGKVSEGLDFADHAGRAVVITGMPFATRMDPKVRLKREYLDVQALSPREGCKMLKLLTGEDWYNQQASRAVNQAVGRVIRHRHDYGAIIFCDERFAHPNRQSQVSLWIQPHIKCYTKFGDVVFTLTRFFRDGASHCPAKQEQDDHENMELSSSSANKSVPEESIKESLSGSTPFSLGLELCGLAEMRFMGGLVKFLLKILIPKQLPSGSKREIKTAQPLDKSNPELIPALSISANQTHSEEKSSSLVEVKSNNSSQLGDILPANLSCFTPCMNMKKLKRSCDMMVNEKKLSITGRGKIQHHNQDVIDLTDDLLLDSQQRKQQQFASCSMKKCKVPLKLDALQHDASSNDYASDAQRLGPSDLPFTVTSVKRESLQISGARSVLNASVKHDRAVEVDAKFPDHKSKGVHLSAEPRGAEEKKGSAFLIQVKEKLSPAEYKEFVGFMKAMKSQAMKIGNVLQSIVGLFSGPERLPLLERYPSTLNWLSP